jgi:hypothetical protein
MQRYDITWNFLFGSLLHFAVVGSDCLLQSDPTAASCSGKSNLTAASCSAEINLIAAKCSGESKKSVKNYE